VFDVTSFRAVNDALAFSDRGDVTRRGGKKTGYNERKADEDGTVGHWSRDLCIHGVKLIAYANECHKPEATTCAAVHGLIGYKNGSILTQLSQDR